MKVDFLLYSASVKMSSAKKFFSYFGWPSDIPQKGYKITFAIRDKGSPEEKVKAGEVYDSQTSEDRATVWVDMGEFTEKLQEGLMEVCRWTAMRPAPH